MTKKDQKGGGGKCRRSVVGGYEKNGVSLQMEQVQAGVRAGFCGHVGPL